jgi:hypothetical protein
MNKEKMRIIQWHDVVSGYLQMGDDERQQAMVEYCKKISGGYPAGVQRDEIINQARCCESKKTK